MQPYPTSPPITFIIPLEPVAQPRPRVFQAKHGRMAGKIMAVSTPRDSPISTYRQAVAIAAKLADNRRVIEGPIKVEITFVMARLKKNTKKKVVYLREWATSKPDLDNIEKGTLDAIRGILFKDDSQIVQKETGKVYAATDEKPRAIIRVTELACPK